MLPLTTDEGRRPFPIRLRDSHSRAPEGGGGVCQRPRHAANRCGRRDRHVRLDDRAQADFAPARAHGAKKISVKRGHGRMGMHGRRRKVQRAGGEVCGQSKGALACLFRWPMSGCDGLGRHHHRGVGLDGQRECCMFTPAQGSSRGRGTDGQLNSRSGCKDGPERRGVPLSVYETASPHQVPARSPPWLMHAGSCASKAWCRCAAPGGYGATRRLEPWLEPHWSWEHGACGKGGAARGGIPCVWPLLSNRAGGRSEQGSGAAASKVAARGGYARGVQRPKCTCWR